MTSYFSTLYRSFLHLLFPATCLHCHTPTPNSEGPLCSTCLSDLQLLNPIEKCLFCMNTIENKGEVCALCHAGPPPYQGMASAFDHTGAAATLVTCLKYRDRPDLAKGMSAFLALQLFNVQDRMGWPMPTLITPTPCSPIHQLSRGYNQTLLLAEELAQLLNIPCQPLLKRNWLHPPQTGRSQSERKNLPLEAFQWKRPLSLTGEILLLIDDVFTTGSTTRRCAERLLEGGSRSIYVLTFTTSSG